MAKHKNFLQKINANLSSPNCEISESSSSGMSSYSVKLAAKRKRERSADPPDKNDLKHEENQRVKILKIHDENSTAKSQVNIFSVGFFDFFIKLALCIM